MDGRECVRERSLLTINKRLRERESARARERERDAWSYLCPLQAPSEREIELYLEGARTL
jgi:hypothetical protein